MTDYDFTTVIDRTNRDATALDGIGRTVWGFEPGKARDGFDEIPMWVADMNFATCPAVVRAMEERLRHPLFGYFLPSDAYYQSIIDWQAARHGWSGVTRDMIGYENGVHGGIASSISVLTQPGDAVLVHSPTYVGFLDDLKGMGRRTVLSPLARDAQGVWRMDFADMEEKIVKNHIRLAILCSPQNPTGRVWERWELEQAMSLFAAHGVTVISDEIWSDIIFAGHTHIPTASLSDDAASRTIALYAPSKTFNLAGLVGSYHIIADPDLRYRITQYGLKTRYNEMNVLSMHALVGAYGDEGRAWVDELDQILEAACRHAADYFNAIDGCSVAMPQGTYMLFVECGDYLRAHGMTLRELLRKGWDVGVAWQDGSQFAWRDAIRINCALPLTRLDEALDRLTRFVF